MDAHAAEVDGEARLKELPLLACHWLPTTDGVHLGFRLPHEWAAPHIRNSSRPGHSLNELVVPIPASDTGALENLRRELFFGTSAKPLDRGRRLVGRLAGLHVHDLIRHTVSLALVCIPGL